MNAIKFSVLWSGIVLALFCGDSVASSRCAELSGCARKFCEIERQLEQAQRANQQQKVDGLQTALENAKAHCRDPQLRQALLDDIAETQAEIAEYRQALQHAEQSGDGTKIIKYRDKLQAKEQERDALLQRLATGN